MQRVIFPLRKYLCAFEYTFAQINVYFQDGNPAHLAIYREAHSPEPQIPRFVLDMMYTQVHIHSRVQSDPSVKICNK